MARDLRMAILCSLVFHGVLLFTGWRSSSAAVDVERGPVSIEVALWSEAQLPTAEAPAPVPISEPDRDAWLRDEPRPATPAAPTVESVAGHGAFIEAAPHQMRNRPPAYPWLARISGWEGTVVLRVTIESDGRPSDVMVITGSRYPVLDAAAQRAIREWRFVPAKRLGRAVSSTLMLPVRFQLTSQAE